MASGQAEEHESMQGGGKTTGRLVVQEMELHNFKSYAGTQRVGPFHSRLSAVVGPNGSGKSNVIDALLFVFGKKAKQLRLNRVSELIHNSDPSCAPESASVTVYFCHMSSNDEDVEVPGSHFSVTRVAYRNNTSKYFINHNSCHFSDVASLLYSKGVDLDNNRFLILQGEVEQIAMMKPKGLTEHEEGLLEFLEDIIGSNQYIEPIEQQSKRLEALNDDRNNRQQKLKHMERACEKLGEEKAEAEEYLRKERELLEWRSTLLQLCVRDAKHSHSQAERERQQARTELQHENSKHQEKADMLKRKYETYVKTAEERKEIESKLESVLEEFKQYERNDVKQREEHKHAKQKAKQTERKATEREERAEQLEAEAEQLRSELPRLDERQQNLEQQLHEEQERLDELLANTKDESAHIGKQLNEVMKELDPWEVAISEAQAKVNSLASERQLVVDRMNETKRLLQNAQQGKEDAEQRVQQIRSEISENEQILQSQQSLERDATKRKEQAEQQVEKLRETSNELRGQAEQARAALQEEQNKGAVSRAINEAKKTIRGVHGRLGDLGAIDGKFDVAVSTAASAALDYVVVDDAQSAQDCVELLRNQNLGVATMLILDKQQHLEARAKEEVELPKGTVRLFDQIKCAEKQVQIAFYYVLGNTLVAQDLETATQVAYNEKDKRFRRVVTFDGKLLETTGTMSGGGSKPMSGKMRIGRSAPKSSGAQNAVDADSPDRDNLNELEQKLKSVDAQLEHAKEEMENAKQEVETAFSKQQVAQSSVEKLKKELESRLHQIEELNCRIQELQSTTSSVSEEDKQKLEEIDKQYEAASKDLERKQNDASELRNRAQELRESLENVGGQAVKDSRAKVDDLDMQISECKNESARKESQAKSKAQAAERTRSEAKQQAEERDRLKKEQERSEQVFTEIEEEAHHVLEQYNETKKACDQKEEEEKAAKQEYEQLNNEMQEAKSAEIEIQSKLEDKEKAAKEAEESLKKWERKLAKVEREREHGNVHQQMSEDELAEYDPEEVQAKVTYLDASLSEQRPDMSTIEEYNKKMAEYNEGAEELRRVTEKRDNVRAEFERLRKARLDDFMHGFNAISLKLKEMYQMITLGGDAELELVDSLDPFSEGIVFSVRPPKKSWKNISNLSGGERTLSSLALVFALHHHKPTPLYVMDEIDAALDFKNVSIVAHYIKERTRDAQFIIISLRNNMFELSNRLHGIYKTNHQTKTVTIDPNAFTMPTRSPNLEDSQKEAQQNLQPTVQAA